MRCDTAAAAIREDLIAYKRVLGYVPEEPFLYPYLSGREYLQLAARLRCLPERAAAEKIDALLELFSLYEHRFSPIGSYSKGMKQKVLLAAALLHDPELIIFDEPLSGLDVTTALVFRNLIGGLAREGKMISVQFARAGRGGEGIEARADLAARKGGGA